MISSQDALEFRFAIDRGGTFTDIYWEIFNTENGQKTVIVEKLLSVDPNNYNDAPTEVIRRILEGHLSKEFPKDEKIDTSRISSIRMGTTVATNALLERKGERSALLITKGFKDLLHIGNQTRADIFDLVLSKPHKLYEEVVEVDERVLPSKNIDKSNPKIKLGKNGKYFEVVQPLDIEETTKQLKDLYDKEFNSIAIVFLHSYAIPDHEEETAKIAEQIGFDQISISSDVMARQKSVKRGDTCCVDAYLNPHIK